MVENEQRPRGILTPADRKFLRGEKELTGQSARNTRRRIRNRFYQALLDFSELWSFLEERDLELIFQADDDRKRSAVRRSAQDAMALLFLGLWENDDNYRDRLEYAIEQAAFARNMDAEVDLTIQQEIMGSPDEILQRLMDSGFKHVSFNEFDKALTHPDADLELLNEVMKELDSEWDSVDDLREHKEARNNWPAVRQSLPYVISVEPIFEDSEFEESG